MFVKTRRAEGHGWSCYGHVEDWHTDELMLGKFGDYSEMKFEHDAYDVRENIRFPVEEERTRIDEGEHLSHGFVVVTMTFMHKRKPLKLLTNMRTYLCEDNGNTAQELNH